MAAVGRRDHAALGQTIERAGHSAAALHDREGSARGEGRACGHLKRRVVEVDRSTDNELRVSAGRDAVAGRCASDRNAQRAARRQGKRAGVDAQQGDRPAAVVGLVGALLQVDQQRPRAGVEGGAEVIVMSASPGSRSLLTTPSATESLAINDRFPPAVLMLALIKMLRPASRVRLPGLPVGVSVIGLSIVMSSLDWMVTLVPASRARVRKLGATVMVWPWPSA